MQPKKKMNHLDTTAVQVLLHPVNYDVLDLEQELYLKNYEGDIDFTVSVVEDFIGPWYENYNDEEKIMAKEGLFHALTAKKVDYDRRFGQLDLEFDWRDDPRGFLETLWVGLYNEPIPER